MTKARISFLIFMLVSITVMLSLGSWQVKRLHWKENLIAQIDRAYADKITLIPLDKIKRLERDQFVRGEFKGFADFSKSFDLMGQIDDGKQTSHKMLPLKVSQDLTILIDLGPDFKPRKSSNVRITGLLKNAPTPNRFTPANDPSTNTWYSINPAQLNIKNLKPLVILPEHTPWKDYPAQKPELRNAHLQYAIFWFTMAAVIAALTFYYLRRKVSA